MSGIYIPGMEMPKDEETLVIFADGNAALYDRDDVVILEFPKQNRKTIPVPDHGRLVDADAFVKEQTEQICKNCDRRRGMKDGKLTKRFVYAIGDAPCRACDTGDMLDYVDDAPTIIPADGDKDTNVPIKPVCG